MARELTIFVARELPEEKTETIFQKVKELLGPKVLVTFRIDPALVGGAALAWEGKYKDFSVRAKMEEKKEEIEKICRNSLKIDQESKSQRQ